jgi:hypothetical protein
MAKQGAAARALTQSTLIWPWLSSSSSSGQPVAASARAAAGVMMMHNPKRLSERSWGTAWAASNHFSLKRAISSSSARSAGIRRSAAARARAAFNSY